MELIVAADSHCLVPVLAGHGTYFQAVIETTDGKAMSNYFADINTACFAGWIP